MFCCREATDIHRLRGRATATGADAQLHTHGPKRSDSHRHALIGLLLPRLQSVSSVLKPPAVSAWRLCVQSLCIRRSRVRRGRHESATQKKSYRHFAFRANSAECVSPVMLAVSAQKESASSVSFCATCDLTFLFSGLLCNPREDLSWFMLLHIHEEIFKLQTFSPHARIWFRPDPCTERIFCMPTSTCTCLPYP